MHLDSLDLVKNLGELPIGPASRYGVSRNPRRATEFACSTGTRHSYLFSKPLITYLAQELFQDPGRFRVYLGSLRNGPNYAGLRGAFLNAIL